MRKRLFLGTCFLIFPGLSWAQSLQGSSQAQFAQNQQADREKLARFENEATLLEFKEIGQLVPLPRARGVRVDRRLNRKYAWCRPWTRQFLRAMAEHHWDQFGTTFQVNSAVRTVAYQRSLAKRNKNAASTSGPKRSSHLTGSTVDITKVGMSSSEILWWREALLALEKRGLIEATEEFQQAVFHVMVFQHYADPPLVVTRPESERRASR